MIIVFYRYFHGNGCASLGQGIPPTRTINVAHLTYQQKVHFLTSLAMKWFWAKHRGRLTSIKAEN